MLTVILFAAALILFLIAGFASPPPDNPLRSKLVCVGLACMALAEILSRAPGLLRGQ